MATSTDAYDKPAQDGETVNPNDDLIRIGRKRFKAIVDAEAGLRKSQLADKRFADGEQWEHTAKAEREANGDPCLTIDLLGPQVKQIKNQQRAMRPAPTVIPNGGGARPEIAEVFQGVIRNIQNNSDADDAYDQAGSDQAEIGIGWYKLVTEYSDEDGETGDQDIKLERIRNVFSVYCDPSAKRRDRMDKKFLFETADYTPEDLKLEYPKDIDGNDVSTTVTDFTSIGDEGAAWINGDRIRVAKYWYVDTTKGEKTLPNGSKRKTKSAVVRCVVMTGLQVLEKYDWAGKWIPYIPVIGEERDTEGTVDLRGVVRGAKDSQRMFNYQKSKVAEVLALTPLAPFIAEEGQLEGHEKEWEESNRKKIAVLKYKRTGLDGTPDPPPQRNFGEPPIQAMMAEAREAQQLIEAQTGFFNTNISDQGKESGVAIRERRMQGEHGNSDYLDGLARAIRCECRMLIDLIPKIYDVPRVMHILGKDNQPQTVVIHAGQDNAPAPDEFDPQAIKAIYDLGVGKYDVTVNAGTNYVTARQQFAASMEQMFQSNPSLFQIIGDLYFKNLDVPEAQVVAARLNKMLDPRLQDNPQDPAAIAAQAGQLQAQLQQTQQELAAAKQAIATKQAEKQADFDREVTIQKMRDATTIEVARINAAKAAYDANMAAQEERLSTGIQLAHEVREAAKDRAHEADQSAHARAHEAGMTVMKQVHNVVNTDKNARIAADAAASAQAASATQAAQSAPDDQTDQADQQQAA